MKTLFAHSERTVKTDVRHLRREGVKPSRYKGAMQLRVREIRESKGLTVEELAERVGMSKSYLSEIERGKKTVNARRLEQLSAALGCRPTDLLADEAVSKEVSEHLALLARLPETVRREVFDFARFVGRDTE